jgi:hypothetical protein
MEEFEKALSEVQHYYGIKKAKRSGVPLINHIHEGIEYLDKIGSPLEAKTAYCLHPIIQSDECFKENYSILFKYSPIVCLYSMEYRAIANSNLLDKGIKNYKQIKLSPIREVNMMLYGDKMQNRKDFLTYHVHTHPKSKDLILYFNCWIQSLKENLNLP